MDAFHNCGRLRTIARGVPRGLVHLFSYIIRLARYQRRNRRISYDSIKRVLVIEIANIGDVIMAMPVISALRTAFPSAKISMIVSPALKPLVEGAVDEVFTYLSRFNTHHMRNHISFLDQIRKFFELRKERFDLVVELRSDFLTLLLASFGKIKYRVDVSSKRLAPALAKLSCALKGNAYREQCPKHEVDVKANMLEEIGIIVADRQPKIYLKEEEVQDAYRFLEQYNVSGNLAKIIIHPGALWIHRQWGLQNYAAVARRILDKFDACVILTGSESERALADGISSLTNDTKIVNLVGQTSLRQLAAIIRISDLVICNDSMAGHIAGAVDTPAVVLFGAQDPRLFGPRGKHICIIRKPVHCSPCRQDLCLMPQANCMGRITVDEVFSAACGFMQSAALTKVKEDKLCGIRRFC